MSTQCLLLQCLNHRTITSILKILHKYQESRRRQITVAAFEVSKERNKEKMFLFGNNFMLKFFNDTTLKEYNIMVTEAGPKKKNNNRF